MISNRQNRRRGRGSSRGGNRPSTPSKGNAAQLLEKYKGLARDAQMSGDRVQQEYYLQFADHYFRVLEEYNSKQSDQQQQQRSSRHRSNDDDDDTDDQPQQQDQQQDKPKRSTRSTRAKRDDARDEKPSDKPKRSRKPKSDDNAGEGIADALPPAIGNAEDEAA